MAKIYFCFFYFAGSNKGGIIKKAKKCSTISERDKNENPSFQLELSQSYAHGYTLVSLLVNFGYN